MRKKKFILTTILIIMFLTILFKSNNFVSDYFSLLIINKSLTKLDEIADNNGNFIYYDKKLNSKVYFFIPKTLEEGLNDRLTRFDEYPLEHQNIIYNQISKFYYTRKMFELSTIFIEKAIINDNKCHVCYNTRGLVYMKRNNFQEALKDFNYSLSLKKSSEAYYNRHLLYLNHLNKKEKAIADLNTAINTEENHIKSRYSLFFIYISNNNIPETKEVLKKISNNLLLKNNYTEKEIKLRINIFKKIIDYSLNKNSDKEIDLVNSIEKFLSISNHSLDFEEYLLFLSELKIFLSKINKNKKTEIIQALLDKNYNEILEKYIASLRSVSI